MQLYLHDTQTLALCPAYVWKMMAVMSELLLLLPLHHQNDPLYSEWHLKSVTNWLLVQYSQHSTSIQKHSLYKCTHFSAMYTLFVPSTDIAQCQPLGNSTNGRPIVGQKKEQQQNLFRVDGG